MMRKFFGRKKDDDEEKEETEEVVEETPKETPEEAPTAPSEEPVEVEEESPEEVEAPSTEGDTVTMPYHATIQDRLKYMLTEPPLNQSIEAPDEFMLEFMAMGERFMVAKKPMGEIEIATGAAPDEDVFIRIGNDVVTELLSAASFSEFSVLYLKYYKNPEPGKFVKIELRKPITELNRRGYARVSTLKLLIGAAR
ncbi:MAG: hypothetical protein KAQ65_03405 [Candidatus Thorarchaeota archaeon]|nr:hypothetical protein [Candidatus Thorarchaeota archaeon]